MYAFSRLLLLLSFSILKYNHINVKNLKLFKAKAALSKKEIFLTYKYMEIVMLLFNFITTGREEVYICCGLLCDVNSHVCYY